MNIGQLREAIKDLPDEMPVQVQGQDLEVADVVQVSPSRLGSGDTFYLDIAEIFS